MDSKMWKRSKLGVSKPISGLKAGAFGQEDEWPTLRSGMPFIPRLKSLGFSGMTYKFVGDRRSGIVHGSLIGMQKCRIREIPTVSLVFFDPDTLEQATAKGFAPCPACLPFNQKIT